MVLPTRSSVPETPNRAVYYQAGTGNVLSHFAELTTPDVRQRQRQPQPQHGHRRDDDHDSTRATATGTAPFTFARAMDQNVGMNTGLPQQARQQSSGSSSNNRNRSDAGTRIGSGSPSETRTLSRTEQLEIYRQTKQDAASVKATRASSYGSSNGGNAYGALGSSSRPPSVMGRDRVRDPSPGSRSNSLAGSIEDTRSNQAEVGALLPPAASSSSSSSQMFSMSFSPPARNRASKKRAETRTQRRTSANGSALSLQQVDTKKASNLDVSLGPATPDTAFMSDSYSLMSSMMFLARDIEEEELANKSESPEQRAFLYKKRYMDVYGLAASMTRRLTELEKFRLAKLDEIEMLKNALQQQTVALELAANKNGESMASTSGTDDESSKEKLINSLSREVGIMARQLSERDAYIDSIHSESASMKGSQSELHMRDIASGETSNQTSKGVASKTSHDQSETLNELREKVNHLEQERKMALGQVETMSTKVLELQKRLDNANASRLQVQKSMVETEHQLESVHAEWLKEKSNLEEQLEALKKKGTADFYRLLLENAKLKTELERSVEAQSNMRSRMESARNESSRSVESVSQLQQQLQESKSQIALFAPKEVQLKKLDEDLVLTREELRDAGVEVKRLRLALDEKTKELENETSHSRDRMSVLENRLYEGEIVRRSLHNKVMELKGNIRVFCRVRPVLKHERLDQANEEIFSFPDYVGERRQIELIAGPRSHVGYGQTGTRSAVKKYPFDFDLVFNGDCSQEDIFLEVSALVQSALDGFDVCVFAYGQTGSGKTYTMQGVNESGDDSKPSAHMGLVGRAISHIYATIEDLRSSGWEFTVSLEMIEIYNESLRDLLSSPGSSTEKVDLRLDADGKPVVTNSCVHIIENERAAWKLLNKAMGRRSTKSTNMNDRSSRSHCVISFRLSGLNEVNGDRRTSVVNLVDLAGSERLSKSGSGRDKETLKEAQCINKSLSALGNVICALAKKSSHIPYRDSKLTHFLSPSLGGDSKTLMICNVSPLGQHRDETLNSLRFAKTVNSCEIAFPSYGNRS